MRIRGALKKGGIAELQTSVSVRIFIFLSMPEEEIKKRQIVDRWQCRNIVHLSSYSLND